MKKKIVFEKGYRKILRPKHKRANKAGYIYEHVFLAEQMLGRELLENEVVHHMDGDRGNNRLANLLVLTQNMHAKLHVWLGKGAPGLRNHKRDGRLSGHVENNNSCEVCGIMLQGKQIKYCSNKHRALDTRKVEWPTKEELETLIDTNSYLQIGKLYGVSDNAVRKWAKKYGILNS